MSTSETLDIDSTEEDQCEGRDTCALCGSMLDLMAAIDQHGNDLEVSRCPDPDCGWVCLSEGE